MRVPRIFTAQELSIGSEIELESQASAHLSRVLRCKENDVITLFNGMGGEFSAAISNISKKSIVTTPLTFIPENKQSTLLSTIAVALSKGDKMDFIVQKCTELGANCIVPIITERSDIKLDTDRAQKKLEHWQQISISACEQSERNILPMICHIQSFTSWVNDNKEGNRYIFHPNTRLKISDLSVNNTLTMGFGSEGGFSTNEISFAQKAGFKIVGLGPRILRAETAPVAAMAIAQTLWGDF